MPLRKRRHRCNQHQCLHNQSLPYGMERMNRTLIFIAFGSLRFAVKLKKDPIMLDEIGGEVVCEPVDCR